MMKLIVISTLALFVSGCGAFYVQESFVHERRIPTEPPVAAVSRPEKPESWFATVVQSVAGLIPSVFREIRLSITDMTETVASTVRDVKTQTGYERVMWKRSAWFPKDDTMFKNVGSADVVKLEKLMLETIPCETLQKNE